VIFKLKAKNECLIGTFFEGSGLADLGIGLDRMIQKKKAIVLVERYNQI
jgi:hypothetical protein